MSDRVAQEGTREDQSGPGRGGTGTDEKEILTFDRLCDQALEPVMEGGVSDEQKDETKNQEMKKLLKFKSLNQMEDPEGTDMIELDTAFITGTRTAARATSILDSGSSLNLLNLDWARRWLKGQTWSRPVVQRFQMADGRVETVRSIPLDCCVRLSLKGQPLGPVVSARFWAVKDLKFPVLVGREFMQEHGAIFGEASILTGRSAHFSYDPQLNLIESLLGGKVGKYEDKGLRTWESPSPIELEDKELKAEDQVIPLDSAVGMLMSTILESRAARAAEASPAGGEDKVGARCRMKPARAQGCRKSRRKRGHQVNMWKKANMSDEEELLPDVVSLDRLLDSESQRKLTEASRGYVTDLLEKHKKLFEDRTYDPAAKPHVVDGAEIGFDIEEKEENVRYYKSPKPMRLGLAGEARLAEEVDKLIQKGILIKAKNPRHVSNVFLVPKKNPDGTVKGWRVVANFAPLNKLTCSVHGAIPSVSEIWDRLSKAKILSAVDISESFYALVTTERARELLAVRTPKGFYTYARAPMGAQGSPAILTELVYRLLAPFMFGKEACVASYMDDILVFTNEDCPKKHAGVLDKVFGILSSAELNLNMKKIQLFKRYARVLGAVVGCGERRICSEKLGGLLEMEPPRNVPELRRFLGSMSASRDYIPRFSDMAAPLNDLLKKGVDWRWGSDQEISFLRLRKALCSPPVIRLPVPEATGFRLATDASDVAIGGVLEQLQPSEDDEVGSENLEWRVIGYYSRSLRGAERNYSAGDKELTALHQSLKHWGGLLRYAKTNIEVDNKALSYLLTKDESLRSPREWRLAEFLTGFDITLEHIPGVTNSRPDFLSRLPGTALAPAAILDLCAGMGSTLRALAILARKGLIRSDKQLVQYVAVESNPMARAAIRRMYERVTKEFPRMFVTNETETLFPLGHDVSKIVDNARVRRKPFRVDLLLASPPCQSFSRANKRAKGMADDRELFTPVADIVRFLLANTSPHMKWCVENVCFGEEKRDEAPYPQLRKAREQVDALFTSLPGTRIVKYDMCRFVSQTRERTFWTNIPEAHEVKLPMEGAAGTYAEMLERMGKGKPYREEHKYAATNMAWDRSRVHKEGLNDYIDKNGVRQQASQDWEVQEALSGLDQGDSDVQLKGPIPDKDRQRLLGNIWVPPCMAHWIQSAWSRKAIITGIQDCLLIQTSPGIQPLTGFSGSANDFLNRLRLAMQAEEEFATECMERCKVVGGEGIVLDRTVDGVNLFKDGRGRWIIPDGESESAKGLRHALMQSVHEWGHRGGQACLEVMKEHIWWKGMSAAVKDYAASCPRCQISKNNHARRGDQLRPTPIPRAVGVSVSMDLVELPPTRGRHGAQSKSEDYDMLLVVRDRLSKFVRLIPTKKEGLTSEALATIFYTRVLGDWPNLEEVYSDRDPRYIGRAFERVLTMQGARPVKTVAHRPQTDGHTERAIQSVLETLRGELAPVETASNRLPRVEVPTWLELIPMVERVMNAYPHSSTGVAPFKFHTGQEPKHPFHDIVKGKGEPVGDEQDYLERQSKILERAYTVAIRTIEARQEAMRRRFEPNKSPELQVGQEVLIRARRRGVGQKLATRAFGPFVIEEARHPVYKLKRDEPTQTHTFNRDQLIPYRGSREDIPMPQLLESPRVIAGRRGPAQIHRVDWGHGTRVPPTYTVSWRHGGERRDIQEDELVSAYTPEAELADAVKALLTRRKFSKLDHINVPVDGEHENYLAYKSHYDLMKDTGRGAVAPRYEPSGNSAQSPGGWVLTAECRRRATYLRSRGTSDSESESEEEEENVNGSAVEQMTIEELVREREELLRQTRERAAQLAAEVPDIELEGELATLPPDHENEEIQEEIPEVEENGEREKEDGVDGTHEVRAEATDQEASTQEKSDGSSSDTEMEEREPETPKRRLRPRDPVTRRVVHLGTEAPQESTLMLLKAEELGGAKTAMISDDFLRPSEVWDETFHLYYWNYWAE